MPRRRAVCIWMEEMPVPGETRAAVCSGSPVTRAISSTPVQVVIRPQHGIVAVDVPAAKQVHLLAAVNNLPVGKIPALLAPGDRSVRVAVERQGQAVLFSQIQQARQQPGIAPGGQQQVGVVVGQQRAQVHQQRAGRRQRKDSAPARRTARAARAGWRGPGRSPAPG